MASNTPLKEFAPMPPLKHKSLLFKYGETMSFHFRNWLLHLL